MGIVSLISATIFGAMSMGFISAITHAKKQIN